MKTTSLTIRVPEGARWMTTDSNGWIEWWSEKPEPNPDFGGWYLPGKPRNGIHLGSTPTRIPCPMWRESLRRIEDVASETEVSDG